MIALLLLQASLAPIGAQALPATGCAAFLWSRTDTPQLVAMVGAEPGRLRVSLDGRPLDLPRTGAEGVTVRGLATTSRYAAGEVSATLELNATEQPGLADGALVGEAMLTVNRAGQDTIVTPLGGLIGCATPTGGRR